MGDIGKPRRRVIRVPATPIRKPVQEPSPAPKPAPEPVREPARTGYAHDEPGARSQGTIWDAESLEKALTEVLTAEVDEDTAQRLVEAIVGVLTSGEPYPVLYSLKKISH